MTPALRALYARLYSYDEGRARAWALARALMLAWIGCGAYTAAWVLPGGLWWERALTGLGLGIIGPLLPSLGVDLAGFALWVEVASRLALLVFLIVVGLILNPPTSARREHMARARSHAEAQGRAHPSRLDLADVQRYPDLPLARIGGREVGLRCGADAGHVAVVAPTRSGKGLHLTQALLRWPAAAVVVDPKGEQWQRTAAHRARVVGPVYRLPPSGVDLLGYFDMRDALDRHELFALLMQPWRDRDPSFAEKSLALFEAAGAVGQATGDHPLRVLAGWTAEKPTAVLSQARAFAPGAIDRFLDGDLPTKPNRFALTAWGIFSARVAPLAPHVATWTVAGVPREWDERRATVYLCYPLPQLQAAGALVGAVVAALLRGQVARAGQAAPALFAIDELPAVGLRGLEGYLATVGSARVTVLFYAQALTQLTQVYDIAGARSILGNCHHQVYYPPRDVETAREVGRLFGTRLALTTSTSRGPRGASDGMHEAVREALDVAEVLSLPEQAVVALTMVGGRQVRLLGERIDPRGVFRYL